MNRQQRCAVIDVALRSTWVHINDYEMRSIMFLFYPVTLTMQVSQNRQRLQLEFCVFSNEDDKTRRGNRVESP